MLEEFHQEEVQSGSHVRILQSYKRFEGSCKFLSWQYYRDVVKFKLDPRIYFNVYRTVKIDPLFLAMLKS